MSAIFTEAEHQRIADAIRQIESVTTGEIVCVVARRCEPYEIISLLWSALAGLLTGAVLSVFWTDLPVWGEAPVILLPAAQLAVAALVWIVLRVERLRMLLVPAAVKNRRAARLARTQFLQQGLHGTEGRTGILIFAAIAEHYVEVIADKGINDRVDPGVWNDVIGDFTGLMRQGRTVDAFEGAIAACGDLLKSHAPSEARNPNELPDHLIEI